MKQSAPKIIEKVKVTGVSAEGRAVGKKDKLVIFINHAVPGDLVDIRIIGKDKKFLIGLPIHYHEKSEERTTAFCKHFGTCGGCKWQHMNYSAQLNYKQLHVEDNLRKISKLHFPTIQPIVGSQHTTYYRNKLEYTFSNKKWLTPEELNTTEKGSQNALGFHIPRMFDKILDIEECHLQAAPSNAIRLAVKEFAEKNKLTFFDLKEQTGFLRNLIIRTTTTGEIMVIVQFAYYDRAPIFSLMNFIKNEFPEITSLLYIVNEKKNETFYDLPVKNFHGLDFIKEKMGHLVFRIGPKTFYQTNSVQAHELYKKVEELAALTGDEIVYDLYTGAGTIACYVASKAKKVIGIESVEDAVEDAKKNAGLNGLLNTEFFAGDMKDMLSPEFIKKHGKPKVVITDPPRAGMHAHVIKALNQLRVQRIIYVSCNPATQARDLEGLGEVYEPDYVQPVDMFPHTHHVENIVRLHIRK